MIEGGFLNIVWVAVLVYGLVAAARRTARSSLRQRAERAAARTPLSPSRSAPRPAPRPTPQRVASPRPAFPAYDAVAAFPELDLSLPGAEAAAGGARAAKRHARAIAGGAAFGSRSWAANAIVGAEILGQPLALRPGATFGAPRAF